jgi:nucleotide-binding universal stress UspA family protein
MYQSVIVGTDGSKTATRAVDRAVEVARAHEASLTVFSAGGTDRAQAVVDREAARLRDAGVDVATRTADGEPAHALVEAARDGDHDLLVVGNKGLVGIRRVLPSVPSKVTHRLPCSLLVVKTT